MKNIALIHGHSIPFFDEWHHVGFWKRTLDEMDDVRLHLYTWDTWQTMPSGLDCDNGLNKLGTDGEHFVTYDESLNDFLDKFDYYLKHEAEREIIARSGHQHFSQNHTYKHRVEKIFRDLGI